jgi:glycosyltransferase involved in cell wall biosynthesis
MVNRVSILHSSSSIAKVHGGTAVFLSELCRAQVMFSADHIALVTPLRRDNLPIDKLVSVEYGRPIVRGVAGISPFQGSCVESAFQKLEAARQAPDICHLHGVWLRFCHDTMRSSIRRRIPVILSPHGMLEPWPLNHNGLKKRLAMAIYQRRDLERVRALHATSEMEAAGLRKLGLRQPIAVIPVGVNMPMLDEVPKQGKRVALFLSRIHPKKGILDLVNAWKALKPDGWKLVIAGNADGEHLKEVLAEIRKSGMAETISYVGEVFEGRKDAVFRSADLFILPTYSENFGIVIAEALSYGVPVLTTHAAPWRCLGEERCGWSIGIGTEALAEALGSILRKPSGELREMGQRGRLFAEKNLKWSVIAEAFAETYRWVLQGGETPKCIK